MYMWFYVLRTSYIRVRLLSANLCGIFRYNILYYYNNTKKGQSHILYIYTRNRRVYFGEFFNLIYLSYIYTLTTASAPESRGNFCV